MDVDQMVIDDCIKQGNLNEKMLKQDFNSIYVKIETLEIQNRQTFFAVKVNQALDMRLDPPGFLMKED